MTALLERVKFLGGNGGREQEPAEPVELPELEPGFSHDPEPAPETRAKPKRDRPTVAPRAQKRVGGKFVSREQAQKDLADELNMWLKVLAATWSITDEPCAAALNETSALIAQDFAKLGARSDWIMDKFQTTSLLGDLMQAALHAKPVVQAMYRHHWSKDARAMRAAGAGEEENYDVAVVSEHVDTSRYAPWRGEQQAA